MERRQSQLRTVVVGDQPLLRTGLTRLIREHPGYVVDAECADATEALDATARGRADAVVVDLSAHGLEGMETLRMLRSSVPGVPVLLISSFRSAALAARALQNGASGYITLSEQVEELLHAVETVARGHRYVPSAMHSEVMERLLTGGTQAVPSNSLSERELQVFALVGEGSSSSEIAERLRISEKTVHTHRESIKRKLRLRSAAALVHAATLWVADVRGTSA